jgi:hypothetical protein
VGIDDVGGPACETGAVVNAENNIPKEETSSISMLQKLAV